MAFLSVNLGRLSIPAETSLFAILNQCFTKIKAIFNLNDPRGLLAGTTTLERILRSIFDTTSLAFVTEKSVRILRGLDNHDKLRLYVQAVAGIVLIFRRLKSTGIELSPSLLSRELQLFAESDQRHAVLDKIGGSSSFTTCRTKKSMVDFVMAAIEGRDVVHHGDLPLNAAGEDLWIDGAGWISDRPRKNMGLPWGFTIMAIN